MAMALSLAVDWLAALFSYDLGMFVKPRPCTLPRVSRIYPSAAVSLPHRRPDHQLPPTNQALPPSKSPPARHPSPTPPVPAPPLQNPHSQLPTTAPQFPSRQPSPPPSQRPDPAIPRSQRARSTRTVAIPAPHAAASCVAGSRVGRLAGRAGRGGGCRRESRGLRVGDWGRCGVVCRQGRRGGGGGGGGEGGEGGERGGVFAALLLLPSACLPACLPTTNQRPTGQRLPPSRPARSTTGSPSWSASRQWPITPAG
ncbi:hypothetical protein BJ546DRAFT_514870 [Cryomyces antarcticus]